jgi:hypothetical protein
VNRWTNLSFNGTWANDTFPSSQTSFIGHEILTTCTEPVYIDDWTEGELTYESDPVNVSEWTYSNINTKTAGGNRIFIDFDSYNKVNLSWTSPGAYDSYNSEFYGQYNNYDRIVIRKSDTAYPNLTTGTEIANISRFDFPGNVDRGVYYVDTINLSYEWHYYTFYGYSSYYNEYTLRTKHLSIQTPIAPTVVTLNATGVEDTNATLWGYLESDGGDTCEVGFEWGYTTSYGANTSSIYQEFANLSFDDSSGSGGYGSLSIVQSNYTIPDPNATAIWRVKCDNMTDPVVLNMTIPDSGLLSDTLQVRVRFERVINDAIGTCEFYNYTSASWEVLYNMVSEVMSGGGGTNYSKSVDGDWSTYVCGAFPYTWLINKISGAPGIYEEAVSWYINRVVEGENFSYNLRGLEPGQIYHYRAIANNSIGSNVSSVDKVFLTRPQAPTSFDAELDGENQVNLTWTIGTGANYTYIERNTTANWSRGEGTMVYNGTSDHYEDTFLPNGTEYYYQAWSFTTWTHNSTLSQWSSNYSEDSAYALGYPNVTTNASTGVEETNATLHGYLENAGGSNCTVRFEYGMNTSYGTNTTNQTKTTGDAFTANISSLSEGQLYHYRSYAENQLGIEHGEDYAFLTKPLAPTSFIATQSDVLQITLNWTKGTGANLTYIERNTSETWERGQGTLVYNSTGNNFNDYNITPDSYYYQAWSYTNWTYNPTIHQYSDDYNSSNETVLPVTEPSVTTNDATGVAYNNATLQGYLNYDGNESCSVWFEYGYTTSYGTSTSNQTKNSGETFSADISPLTRGHIYNYRAVANNSNSTVYGTNKAFLTKPIAPKNLTVEKYDGLQLNLSWLNDYSANTTYIERNTSASWSIGQGTPVYNDSGQLFYDYNISVGTVYYYQAWSYTEWGGLHQYSATYDSDSGEMEYYAPTVATNDATFVGETTAILNGYLVSDGGDPNVNVSFEWGETTSYGNVTQIDTDTFEHDIIDDEGDGGRDANLFNSIRGGQNTSFAFTPHDSMDIYQIRIFIGGAGCSLGCTHDYMIYINNGEIDDTYGEGTLVVNSWQPAGSSGYKTIPLDTNYSIIAGHAYELEVVANFSDSGDRLDIGYDNSATTTRIMRGSTPYSYYPELRFYGVLNNTFSTNLSGLSPGQLYHYRAFATNSNSTTYGSDKTFLTKPLAPTNFIPVTDGDKQINMTWTKGTGANYTYIERDTTANWSRGDGTMVYNNTGTIYNDTTPTNGTYFYQAWSYSEWGSLHQWSDENASGSNESYGSPTVQTNDSTNVEEDSATLNGYIISDGGNSVTTVGFEWGKNTSYGFSNSTSYSTDSFSYALDSLEAGQLYRYRAFATNGVGTAYGSDKAFLTKPNVTVNSSGTVVGNKINISWTKGDGTNNTYIERNTSETWERGEATMVYNDTGTYFTETLTGGTYYYQIWSYSEWTYNPTVHQWSDDYDEVNVTFVTAPSVTTNDATGEEEYNATLHGQLTEDGGESCKVGFEYGETTSYGGTTTSNYNPVDDNGDGIADSGRMFVGTVGQYRLSTEIQLEAPFVTTFDTIDVNISSVTGTDHGFLIDIWIAEEPPDDTNSEGVKLKDDWNPAWSTGIQTIPLDIEYTIKNDTIYSLNFVTYGSPPPLDYDDRLGLKTDSSGGYYRSKLIGSGFFHYYEWGDVTLYKEAYDNDYFLENVSWLSPGQLYHFRAYANNSNSTAYGSDKTLLTKPLTPTSFIATEFNSTQLNLTWTIGTGANNTYIERNTSETWTKGQGTIIYNGTGTEYDDWNVTLYTTYFYHAWSYTEWDSLNQWSDDYVWTVGTPGYGAPNVITHDATNIEETNATLEGLLADDGDETCSVWFIWGTNDSYGTKTTNQTKNTADLFYENLTGLTPGQIYRYKAVANNSNSTQYGDDVAFLARPNPPDGFTVENKINYVLMNWSIGSGANLTYIERNDEYSWNRGEGTAIYNDTGTWFSDTNISAGESYFYRAWSYANWTYNSTIHSWSTPVTDTTVFVTTNTTTNVTDTTAIGHGYVLYDGMENCTAKICYDTSSVLNQPDTTIYYFNSYNSSAENWGDDPDEMVDGVEGGTYTSHYARDSSGDNQFLDGNTCPGTILGEITKVELRAFGKGRYGDSSTMFTPLFDGTDEGDDHLINWTVQSSSAKGQWEDWWDITNDTNSPVVWNWDDIQNLELKVDSYVVDGSNYVAKVDIRVSYITNYSNCVTIPYLVNTGDEFEANLTLNPGQLYYVSAYINNSEDDAYGEEVYHLQKPSIPTGVTFDVISDTSINISWNIGAGSNTTVLVEKEGGYPASPTDGMEIYNGTGSYVIIDNLSFTNPYYYSLWGYADWETPTLHQFSEQVDLPFGGLLLYCYDEETSENLTFDVFIANEDGSDVYEEAGLTNPAFVNTTAVPFGDISVQFFSDDHEDRVYYFELLEGAFYTLTGYLPKALPPGGEGDPDYDPENETYATLYLCTVVDPYDLPVEDAYVEFRAYTNITGEYESISKQYTDANGQVSVYLIPGKLLKVRISKDGFQTDSADWIPDPDIHTHTFKLLFTEEIPDEIATAYDNLTWSLEPEQRYFSGNFTIWFNISNPDGELEGYWMDIYYYNETAIHWELLYEGSGNNSYGGVLSYNVSNVSGDYKVEVYFDREGYDTIYLLEEGSRFYFISWGGFFTSPVFLEIPDWIYVLVLVIIMIVVMGFLFPYMGLMTGYVGIGIFALGLALKPELAMSGVSGWFILVLMGLVYTIAIFLWSRL